LSVLTTAPDAALGLAPAEFDVEYITEDGARHKGLLADAARVWLADMAPAPQLKDLAAFEATRRACALTGWKYRLVGATDPVGTVNLRWLSGCRHPRFGFRGRVPGRDNARTGACDACARCWSAAES
jgi:hypothetical protein